MRLIDADSYRKQLLDQIQLGGSEGCLFGLEKAVAMLDQRRTVILSEDEPLTQADLDNMEFCKVWISYGPEPDNGEEAVVYHGRIYCIGTLEGAGFEDVLNDLLRGEALGDPTGHYKVYRCRPSAHNLGPVQTASDWVRSMTDEELAAFLRGVCYGRNEPWEKAFKAACCDHCPTVAATDENGRHYHLHECDFADGVCPHGDSVLWWLVRPRKTE